MDKKYTLPDEEPQLAAEPQRAYETMWAESDVLEADVHEPWQTPLSDEEEHWLQSLDKTPSLHGGLSTAAAAHILLQVEKSCQGRTFDELWETAAPIEEVQERLLASIGT